MARAHDVVIVGGGLSGLVAMRGLCRLGLDVVLLEARPRLGGRIFTLEDERGHYDLGPAWFWPHHREVFDLAEELGIPFFKQFEEGATMWEQRGSVRQVSNPSDSVSYRLDNGTGALITALQRQVPEEKILLGHKVTKLAEKDDLVAVHASVAGSEELRLAQRVIITLPPRLAAYLDMAPEPPVPLLQAMRRTPTWMGSAMKVAVGYEGDAEPFWRQRKQSGFAVSDQGPCQQIHDHCSEGGSMRRHALFGWIDEDHPSKRLSKEERKERVLQQFVRLFGKEAGQVCFYAEHDWKGDEFTHHPDEPEERLSHHPRYGDPNLRLPALGGKVFLAGTETSERHGGFLAGAIHSGNDVARRMQAQLAPVKLVSL